MVLDLSKIQSLNSLLINPENLENPESDIKLFDYNLEELYYFYYFYFQNLCAMQT